VNAPGRWHDSHVLQRSTLYADWENPDPDRRRRPFPGAVILGRVHLKIFITGTVDPGNIDYETIFKSKLKLCTMKKMYIFRS
jgi:hypothetical protein